MPFKIVRNVITKMNVDAIVNTANEEPMYSSGTDTAVYKAAGEEELLAIRKNIGFKEEGEVFITPGLKLHVKYIIHAVSPCFIDGTFGAEEKLRGCYRKSLELARENKCESIAFPLISSGSFGYPKEEAMRIAVDEINAFLLKHNMLVYMVVFDDRTTGLGQNLYPDLEAYIDSNYVRDMNEVEYGNRYFGVKNECEDRFMSVSLREKSICMPRPTLSAPMLASKAEPAFKDDEYEKELCFDISEVHQSSLDERMEHLSDTFQEYLLYLIETKGMTNAEVYNRAIVTKQVFSKLKLNKNYHPDKSTAMRLCVGAKLNLDETKDLLARAGYALSPCDKRDIIFSYFIENEIYEMIDIDIVLEERGLPCFIE